MNLAHLTYFLEASRTLNYTQAADRLFTSRQNLTHAVKELERELGVRLFSQEKGSLVLTIEGEEAARRAAAIVREVDRLKSLFSESDGGADPLHVLIGLNLFSFSPYDGDIETTIDAFSPDFCRFSELDCGECYEEVAGQRADLAVIVCMKRDFPGCESVLLHQDRLYLLIGCESPLAAKDTLTVRDLAPYRLMAPHGYEFQLAPLVSMLEKRTGTARNIDNISSFKVVRKSVLRGGAIGIASASFKNRMPEGLTIRPLSDPGTEMGLYAIFRKDSPKKHGIMQFIDQLMGRVSET